MTAQACANVSASLSISATQLLQNLQEHEKVLDNSVRVLHHELPVIDWLAEYLAETLQPTGFIVDTQNKKTKAVAPVNEYITSKPDLLIYNAHFTSHLGAVYIDLVLFQNDELSAKEVLITGANGENECFYNMFSQGTNLAMKAISTGSIPTEIQMYGIAVAIKKPQEAKLLYMKINLEKRKCFFRRSLEFFDFSLLLNILVGMLSLKERV